MSESIQAITAGGAGPGPGPAPAVSPTGHPGAPRPAAPADPPRQRSGAGFPSPAAFRANEAGPEDRLIAQVAFAMAAETGTPPPDAEAIRALREQATAALSDFAFRYLHNRVEEIRREAAAEATGAAARGPGFVRLVLANIVAIALAGGAAYALAQNADLLARLTGH